MYGFCDALEADLKMKDVEYVHCGPSREVLSISCGCRSSL